MLLRFWYFLHTSSCRMKASSAHGLIRLLDHGIHLRVCTTLVRLLVTLRSLSLSLPPIYNQMVFLWADEKIKLWLFIPGRHSSISENAQSIVSRLKGAMRPSTFKEAIFYDLPYFLNQSQSHWPDHFFENFHYFPYPSCWDWTLGTSWRLWRGSGCAISSFKKFFRKVVHLFLYVVNSFSVHILFSTYLHWQIVEIAFVHEIWGCFHKVP